jgi:hypothetical protein
MSLASISRSARVSPLDGSPRATIGTHRAVFLASFGFEALQSDPKLSLLAISTEMQAQGFVDENGEAYSAADVATMLGHGLGRYKAAG